jgi:hypothetical protein
LAAGTEEFVIRIKGICLSDGRSTNYGRFGMAYELSVAGQVFGTNTSYCYGFWNYGNMDKIIRAAGNITALTNGETLGNNAYGTLFFKCRMLEDISGLVFTDTSVGNNFLTSAFERCTALKEIPAGLLPEVTTVGSGFLSRAFRGSGVETIPTGFLPNLTSAGNSFLLKTFEENEGDRDLPGVYPCPLREIPADFIPATLTSVGNSFLHRTFSKCNQLTSIPANLVSHITSVGNDFLYETFFTCTNLTSVPSNFGPQSLTAMGNYFLRGTFYTTGITEIPADFLPPGYNATGTYFLSNTFTDCKSLTKVDLDFLKNVTVSNSYFLGTAISNCNNLTEVHIPYINTNGKTNPFNLTFRILADDATYEPLTVYIHGGGTQVLAGKAAASLATPNEGRIVAVYVDSAELVTAYQASDDWKAISDSKFLVNPDK